MKTKSAAQRSQKEDESNYELKLGGNILKLTNQQKLYWPEEKITKGDLVKYYSQVANFILPYIKNRPQSLHRFPNGIKDAGFYQKDVDTATIPPWLKTEKIYSESNKEKIDYLICNDKATLIYMANLGCIEINPWNSKIGTIDKPDWAVIDLDPEDISFKEVVKAAVTTKKVCDKIGVECYCKTSGATGMHIFIPLGAKYEYETVRAFAGVLAQKVNDLLPDTTSIVRAPKNRQKKVYLDFLQNSRGQTIAAPYSVRPKAGATVSTPLDWSEVNQKLTPAMFTIKNMIARLDKKGDLWKPVLGKGANLKTIISELEKI